MRISQRPLIVIVFVMFVALMAPSISHAAVVQCVGTWYAGKCWDQNQNELVFVWSTPVSIKVTTTLSGEFIGPGYLAHFYWKFLNTPTTFIHKRTFVKVLDGDCFAGICLSTTDTWVPDTAGRWEVDVFVGPPSGQEWDFGATFFYVGEGPPPPPPPDPNQIPTLGRKGLIGLVLVLGAFGAWTIRKKVLHHRPI